jgi:hypothetical protein
MPDLTPEERHRIYQEEKARFEAQSALRVEHRNKTKSGWMLGCLWIVGIGVALIIIGIATTSDTRTTTAPTTPLTEQEKLERGCQVVKLTLGAKRISELSVEDLRKIQLCQTLGYYK